MLRGNVLSGAPFRVAILCLFIFILILLVMGSLLYARTQSSMFRELEAQIRGETILLQQVFDEGGKAALIDVITQLEEPVIAEQRIAGLFDSEGKRLAGNAPMAPDFVGWRTRTLTVTAPGASDQYHLFTARLETSTLVVGRSTQFITATLKQLLYDFAFAGVLGALASLLIGYLVSKRMFVKLARLAGILDSVSRGDMQVRLPVDKSNDQIDRVSQQINAHLDQLAMLMSATRNTVNSIAHDLRAPLNRTYLLLQDALEAQDADSKTGKLIDDAGKELNKVNEIIDTILRIARIQGGSDQPYFNVFSLTEQVSDLADIFQPIIESADQVLIRKIPSTPDVQVYGDKKMLRQMLVNLIENAICHCPAGTQITLVTGKTPQHGGFVQVVDTGPGIDESLREKVLEPFFRVDASRTSPGSGLGLTLVKAIVMRHAAELSLEDNEPGLRVTVTFPPIQPGMDTGS